MDESLRVSRPDRRVQVSSRVRGVQNPPSDESRPQLHSKRYLSSWRACEGYDSSSEAQTPQDESTPTTNEGRERIRALRLRTGSVLPALYTGSVDVQGSGEERRSFHYYFCAQDVPAMLGNF
ncbi:hypothetical protein LZ554_001260 [Drepanopeziza brunnea f. sp. 'monogermtubi']|nr:hypothetical protein LZ554_001260 [Drepanopeziza brunnea f. sp. 'monogermtubi']